MRKHVGNTIDAGLGCASEQGGRVGLVRCADRGVAERCLGETVGGRGAYIENGPQDAIAIWGGGCWAAAGGGGGA